MDLKIKIHAFYLIERAKEAFEFIARRTGGSSDHLLVDDIEKSSQMLTDLVCTKVLSAAAQSEAEARN